MFVIKNDIVQLLKSYGCQATNVYSFDTSEKSFIHEKDIPAFQHWLSQQAHGEMLFLEKNIEARKDPAYVLPGVKSALVCLFPYSLGHRVRGAKNVNETKNTPQNSNETCTHLISRYARGRDYHKVLKKKLENIAIALQEYLGESFSFRAVVDSIPFFDRAYAREVQLGFIGKNTMLIRPGMGSFFFIATLLLDIPYTKITCQDEKKNYITSLNCGSCTKCMDACPTGAITQPYFLDASRCLSYFSIEHRDLVPEKYISYFANTIYGCDICQEVCPYNFVTSDFKILKEFAQRDAPFHFVTVKAIALMTQVQYEQWFSGTAVTRGKYQGLVRNALYHLYATQHPELAHVLDTLVNSKYELIFKTVAQIKGFYLKDK